LSDAARPATRGARSAENIFALLNLLLSQYYFFLAVEDGLKAEFNSRKRNAGWAPPIIAIFIDHCHPGTGEDTCATGTVANC
jgi:hypothetical protein